MKRDLARLPADLAESTLAATAQALARELDAVNSATSKSMCANALRDTMKALRDLAPPVAEEDGLDEISARRAARIARKGSAGTKD